MVKTQLSKHIEVFRYDNALEYTQHAFQNILHSYGIVHQLTCPALSKKMAKPNASFNISLTQFVVSCCLFSVPTSFWGVTILIGVHASITFLAYSL